MSTTWNPQTGERRLEPQAAPKATVHSTWNATIRTALGAAIAVTLILLAFAWPTKTATVHDMPLGVVATAAQRDALAQKLHAAGDPFVLTEYADEAAARQAIERREVYGAVVLPSSPQKPVTRVLTASAASTAATQVLSGMVQKMAGEQMATAAEAKQKAVTELTGAIAQASAAKASAQTLRKVQANLPTTAAAQLQPQLEQATAQAETLGKQVAAQQAALAGAAMPQVQVTDVVPLLSTDSRGAGFAIAGLPLAMGGMIGGVMISTLVVGWKRRLAAIAGYGVLGGLGMALVLHSWFAFVSGRFLMTWLVTGLAVAATAAFITGAQSILGQPGIGLGAVLTMFIGNPISSMNMPQEWLPWHWGGIGQWFVPGAAGSLLRIESYFPHAGQWQHWMVLLLWLGVGVVLTLVGRHKNDEVIHLEGYVEPDAPVSPRRLATT